MRRIASAITHAQKMKYGIVQAKLSHAKRTAMTRPDPGLDHPPAPPRGEVHGR